MSYLDVALAARAYHDGRACRTAQFRHRHFVDQPLAMVFWELGAEPFTAAAIGFGRAIAEMETVVAGEPRNRDLAFSALLRFARWFNPQFEASADNREALGGLRTRARMAPQVLVPNRATIEMLGRLGRRLAYLPMDGARPADPHLVRLGQHLLFLHRHSLYPGQQLIVAMADVVNSHWSTALSNLERESLAAVDAYVDPPSGVHGFVAAANAERYAVGPAPDGADDEALEPLVESFNKGRAGGTDSAMIRRLIAPIEAHYSPLIRRTWDLMWRCFVREQGWPEAASVARRWDEDRDSYTWHIDWIAQDGRQRTRQTPRQAAMTMRRLEGAKARLVAEEACDDPLRMIPSLLDNKAVQGRVTQVDLNHYERVRVNLARRPLVTLVSSDPCLIPPGRHLWWTQEPQGREWEVHEIDSNPAGGSTVVLKLTTSASIAMPTVGDVACFSVHTTSSHWLQQLPQQTPWTHEPETPIAPESIEDVA